jgi:hypothetical protein
MGLLTNENAYAIFLIRVITKTKRIFTLTIRTGLTRHNSMHLEFNVTVLCQKQSNADFVITTKKAISCAEAASAK